MDTSEKNLLLVSIALVSALAVTFVVLYNVWLLPFVAVFGIVVGFLFLQYPKPVLIAMLAIRVVIDLVHFLPAVGGLNALELFSGVSTLAFILLFFHRFSKDIERHPAIHLFISWNILLIVHLFTSDGSMSVLTDFLKIFSPVLLLPVISSMMSEEGDGIKVLKIVTIAGGIPVLSSLYYLAAGQMSDPSMVLHGIPRLLGGYKNLRHHGLVMMIFSILGSFQFFVSKTMREKIIWGAYSAGAILCLYMTMIRSALLPFAFAIAIFCWMTRRKNILYLMSTGLFMVLVTSTKLQDRFKDLVLVFTLSRKNNAEELSKLGSGRYTLWSESWEFWTEKPLLQQILGLGYQGHTDLTNATFFAFDFASTRDLDTHNDLLFLLYDFGPFGVLTYVGMVVISLQGAWKLHKIGKTYLDKQLGAICFAAIIALMINNAISNGTVKRITIGWMFWLFAGLSFATLKYYNRQARTEQQREKSTST